MEDKQFFDVLQAINCRYNFKIEKNGKCYSTECMMNQDKWIKSDVKLNGCGVYKRKSVQKLLKDK